MFGLFQAKEEGGPRMGVTRSFSALQIGFSARSKGEQDPGASNGNAEEMPDRHDPGAQPLAHAGPH
jgi:hypothetical protein